MLTVHLPTIGRVDVSFFPMVTREDDVLFSSFVNCIVLSTLYAAENAITKEVYVQMPLITIFGNEYLWALRDASSANGKYDEMYEKHFGIAKDSDPTSRTRNALNDEQNPQLLSLPGLRQ